MNPSNIDETSYILNDFNNTIKDKIKKENPFNLTLNISNSNDYNYNHKNQTSADPLFEKYPWITKNSLKSNGIQKLHYEIWDFFNYIKPKEKDYDIRRDTISHLKYLIYKKFNNWKIKHFGSFYTNLFLKNSDIDLVIFTFSLDKHKSEKSYNNSIEDENKNYFNLLYNYLSQNEDIISNIYYRSSAKVPIITFTYKNSIKVDITFNRIDGIINSKRVKWILVSNPIIRPIYLVIKYIFSQSNMINSHSGKISSYILFLIFYTFMAAYLYSSKISNFYSFNKDRDFNFGFFFREFFNFYGYKYEYDDCIINPVKENIFLNKKFYLNAFKSETSENKELTNNFNKSVNINKFESKVILNLNNENYENKNMSENNNSWYNFENNSYDNNCDDWRSTNFEEYKNDSWEICDEIKNKNFNGWETVDDYSEFNDSNKHANENRKIIKFDYKLRNQNNISFKNSEYIIMQKNISNIYVLDFHNKNGSNIAGNLFRFWIVKDFMKTIRDYLYYPHEMPLVSYLGSFINIEKLIEYNNYSNLIS